MQGTAEERAAWRLKQAHGDGAWGASRVEYALSALERRVRRRRVARVSAAALVAVAGLVVLAGPRRLGLRPAPDPVASARSSAGAPAAPDPSVMRLGDGSTIRPAPGARVTVREVSPDRVRVALDAGRAAFEVAHRPQRQFVVEAAAVQVIVVGTRFSVERVGETTRPQVRVQVRVQVIEGHVRVAWQDQGAIERDLYAGDAGTFPDGTRAVAAVQPAPSINPAPATPVPATRARAAGGEWRRLARGGGYRQAYDLIVAAGPNAVGDDVGDLLLAADAARLSGHPARALPYLDRAIAHGGQDERAPMAAFIRGRIQMGLGRPQDAGASFDRAIALGAQGSLHENALARAIEAYHGAGDGARAGQLARVYVARYPSGRWLGAVRLAGGLDGDEKLPR